ncbi:hypothetical protein D3C86_1051970 [compost metagenome]
MYFIISTKRTNQSLRARIANPRYRCGDKSERSGCKSALSCGNKSERSDFLKWQVPGSGRIINP